MTAEVFKPIYSVRICHGPVLTKTLAQYCDSYRSNGHLKMSYAPYQIMVIVLLLLPLKLKNSELSMTSTCWCFHLSTQLSIGLNWGKIILLVPKLGICGVRNIKRMIEKLVQYFCISLVIVALNDCCVYIYYIILYNFGIKMKIILCSFRKYKNMLVNFGNNWG